MITAICFIMGDNGFKSDPQNKGLTLTAEVLCFGIMTDSRGNEETDKGGEDDTAGCCSLFLTQ